MKIIKTHKTNKLQNTFSTKDKTSKTIIKIQINWKIKSKESKKLKININNKK
jgi:hypothetical protein